jgi:N-acetylglutamate synthase-like GNAT family acetyltransferase
VVLPEYRRRGRAEKMTEIMLEMLANIEISDCYLLTTTAEKLAERLGFTRIDSATAPEAVRASRQFAELCPSSAALMHRKTQYDT